MEYRLLTDRGFMRIGAESENEAKIIADMDGHIVLSGPHTDECTERECVCLGEESPDPICIYDYGGES